MQDHMVAHYRMLTHCYDKSDPNYCNKTLKDESTTKFAARFDIAEAKVKTWLQTNRTRFSKLTRQMRDCPNSQIQGHVSQWCYKHFSFFLQGIAPLLEKDSELHIMCIGGGGFDESETSMIQSLGLEGRRAHQQTGD